MVVGHVNPYAMCLLCTPDFLYTWALLFCFSLLYWRSFNSQLVWNGNSMVCRRRNQVGIEKQACKSIFFLYFFSYFFEGSFWKRLYWSFWLRSRCSSWPAFSKPSTTWPGANFNLMHLRTFWLASSNFEFLLNIALFHIVPLPHCSRNRMLPEQSPSWLKLLDPWTSISSRSNTFFSSLFWSPSWASLTLSPTTKTLFASKRSWCESCKPTAWIPSERRTRRPRVKRKINLILE